MMQFNHLSTTAGQDLKKKQINKTTTPAVCCNLCATCHWGGWARLSLRLTSLALLLFLAVGCQLSHYAIIPIYSKALSFELRLSSFKARVPRHSRHRSSGVSSCHPRCCVRQQTTVITDCVISFTKCHLSVHQWEQMMLQSAALSCFSWA